MKFRKDFVTNSSSGSFICCFARVEDPQKAQEVLDKYSEIEVYTGRQALDQVERSEWADWLEYGWASINTTPSAEYLCNHLDDTFIVAMDSFDIDESEDDYNRYIVNFEDFPVCTQEMFDAIAEENGFADINCQFGAGRT